MGIFNTVVEGLGLEDFGTDFASHLGFGGESKRRKDGQDELFTDPGDFVFVMHGPPDTPAPSGSSAELISLFSQIEQDDVEYIFPLVLNPTEYRFERGFANEYTPTQGGGVYVEDNGSLMGKVFIAGHFGFKPRMARDNFGAPYKVPLSGSKHLQRFEKDFIGYYTTLKKDPAHLGIAHKIYLTFHDSKNNRHVEVVPDRVVIKHGTSGVEKIVGTYEIECTIVDEADPAKFGKESPNKSWLDKIKDAQQVANKTVDVMRAAVRDFVAFQNEISEVISNFGVILSNVENLGFEIEEAKDTRLTRQLGKEGKDKKVSKQQMKELRAQIASTTDTLFSSRNPNQAAATWQDFVEARLTKVETQLAVFEAFASVFFAPDQSNNKQSLVNREQGGAGKSSAELSAADQVTTLLVSDVESTAATPGDAELKRRGYTPVYSDIRKYTGYREVLIRQGDSIEGIASRELGSVDLWPDIALVNNLKPPFISSGGFPGTVTVGDKILIPIVGAQVSSNVFSTGNAAQGASQEESVLGTDFKLVAVDRNAFGTVYDFAVDTVSGGTDFKRARGVENLKQALGIVALGTPIGSNILYPNVGMRPLIGEKGTIELLSEARFRAKVALERDSRVRKASDISFNRVDASNRNPKADQVQLDFKVELVKLNGARPIAVTVS